MTALDSILKQIENQHSMPIEQWQPTQQGDIDITINHQGEWFHEGREIQREKLVALFASILMVENDRHYLMTPVEKLAIQVESTPFVVVSAQLIDQHWFLTNNLGQVQALTQQSRLNCIDKAYPFVNWQRGLSARLNQNVMYQLQTFAIEHGTERAGQLYLASGDHEIAVGLL